MELRIEKVTRKSNDIEKIKKTLKLSFPKEELMPFFMMLILTKMKNIEFLSFHDDKKLSGFIYMSTHMNVTFIIYLAVVEELKAKGYGSAILDKIQEMYPENKIILYIDRCDDKADGNEERIRRKKFYLKSGYEETGYSIKNTKNCQEILIKNGIFVVEEFSLALKKCSNGMLKPNIVKNSN